MPRAFKQAIRNAFSGTLIHSGKYTRDRAERALGEGWADMIGFGRPFVLATRSALDLCGCAG